MSKLKILLLESIHPVADGLLEAEGFEVHRADGALKEDELVARLKGVHLLGIRSKTQVTERALDAADSLVGLGAFCIGTNQIDLDDARTRGVPVFNAPFSNTRSVAELMIAEIVMLSRQLGDRSREVHHGVVAQGRHRLLRGARQDARHRRLRAHRLAGRRARRGAGHARRLLRHLGEAADGQQRAR